MIDSIAAPRFGSAAISPGTGPAGRSTIQYTSQPWFVGNDVITYTLRDTSNGTTETFSTTIEVLGANFQQNATVVAALSRSRHRSGECSAARSCGSARGATPWAAAARSRRWHPRPRSVPRGDRHLPPTPVTRLVSGAANGSLKLNYDGTFEYTPEAGFVGSDSFRFEVFDGAHAVSLIATINVLRTEDDLVLSRLRSLAIGARPMRTRSSGCPFDPMSPVTSTPMAIRT